MPYQTGQAAQAAQSKPLAVITIAGEREAASETKLRAVQSVAAADPSEAALEAKIASQQPQAPRLKPADIDAVIASETYTVMPSGKVMVCEMILRNSFALLGIASAASRENFNEEIGREVSRKNAREQIWQLEGYALHERLAK